MPYRTDLERISRFVGSCFFVGLCFTGIMLASREHNVSPLVGLSIFTGYLFLSAILITTIIYRLFVQHEIRKLKFDLASMILLMFLIALPFALSNALWEFFQMDAVVQISANLVMGSSYETMVKYEQLDPTISVIRTHHKLFWPSMIGIPLFAITTFVTVDSLGFSLVDFLPGLFLTLTLISIFVAVFTRKRVEYARFCSTSGLPLFDIARAGPERNNFDNYVAEIQNRIRIRKTPDNT